MGWKFDGPAPHFWKIYESGLQAGPYYLVSTIPGDENDSQDPVDPGLWYYVIGTDVDGNPVTAPSVPVSSPP